MLGIDEHFFTRKTGYVTTLVDLKNHKVFDVVLGRSELSLMRLHRWNLSDAQHANLMHYLEQFPVLKTLCLAKHRLNKLLLIKNLMPKHGRKFMGRLLKLIGQLAQSPARTLANTLTSWLEPIVRMWRTSKSNGITVGFHTKMEMMSRRAYGFRNFENYRLRVLAHCGWNGVFCRV